MALSQTSSSWMTGALMEPQPVILDSQNAMNAVDCATIERRIRINRPDEGRGRCKGSRAWDPRKDFSQCMQQHKIPSTSNAISPQQERTEPSGHRPCRHGVNSSLRREPEPDVPGDLLRAIFSNVTEPFSVWLAWVGWHFVANGANILWHTFHQKCANQFKSGKFACVQSPT